MYAYINGILDEIENQRVVLDVHGVGYAISVPNTVLPKLPAKGEKVKLYTYFHIREDGQELYGFADKEEKQFFEKLITVTGVGPKAAIGMMSAFTGRQLAVAIVTGDIKLLCSVPGIGKKTAERLVLELKDKIGSNIIREQSSAASPAAHAALRSERLEALEALMALGYQSVDAEKALTGVEGEDASTLVRLALRNLGSRK